MHINEEVPIHSGVFERYFCPVIKYAHAFLLGAANMAWAFMTSNRGRGAKQT